MLNVYMMSNHIHIWNVIMPHAYASVTTRFLRPEERLTLSKERQMPLVIEAKKHKSLVFLQSFLKENSTYLLKDLAIYGAILFRGFEINSENAFENALLKIEGLKGMKEYFMSEVGREKVVGTDYVHHTNTIFSTGGSIYLGGFHNENYFSLDVPSYIAFCCLEPSVLGGETGLINMGKVYEQLRPGLQEILEKQAFYVSKWLISDMQKYYNVSADSIEEVAKHFNLPIIGRGKNRFVLMYKPSIYRHPVTGKKALQINFSEIKLLNSALRRLFRKDYPGAAWFLHRSFWHLPQAAFSIIEFIYVMYALFVDSPKNSLKILYSNIRSNIAYRKANDKSKHSTRVGQCFNAQDTEGLAQYMRDYYVSCLWQKGDILLVDNRQVVHAGMPGKGPRVIRAMLCNPMAMDCSDASVGSYNCQERSDDSFDLYLKMLANKQ